MSVKKKVLPKRTFKTAKQELKRLKHQKSCVQESCSGYRLAFLDQDFLLRRELRSVRLQLELLKPELVQHDAKIKSTIVIFGSARIPEARIAKKRLEMLSVELAKNPDNHALKHECTIAKKMLEKSYYYTQARKLARLIARHGKDEEGNPMIVVTGGGPGVMEAANRGAHEAGAKTIGLSIVLPMEEAPNAYVTPELCFRFHYFAIRKMHFLIRARALVVFPGGYGTLDELFEGLTLVQTKKIEKIPIILVGEAYWRKSINFDYLVEEGMIDPADVHLFSYAETAEQVWEKIKLSQT